MPSFPALEPILAHEYTVRFNGIWLPSVEQVDLTLKLATELVEPRESPTFLSTKTDTSENTTPKSQLERAPDAESMFVPP